MAGLRGLWWLRLSWVVAALCGLGDWEAVKGGGRACAAGGGVELSRVVAVGRGVGG